MVQCRRRNDAVGCGKAFSGFTYVIYLTFLDPHPFIILWFLRNLQKAAHKLNQIITEYGLTISVQKTKSMAVKGRDPV